MERERRKKETEEERKERIERKLCWGSEDWEESHLKLKIQVKGRLRKLF